MSLTRCPHRGFLLASEQAERLIRDDCSVGALLANAPREHPALLRRAAVTSGGDDRAEATAGGEHSPPAVALPGGRLPLSRRRGRCYSGCA